MGRWHFLRAVYAGPIGRALRVGATPLGALWVGLLCCRKDPEVDVLDGLHLLSSAVVPRCLGRRRPDALCMGIGQRIGTVIPSPITQ